MRMLLAAVLLAATLPTPAWAAPAAAPVAGKTAAPATVAGKTKDHYKVQETDLGTLLDDPVSKAILAKYIPEVIANPQIDMGRSMTLSQLQQYAADQITDDKLAKIQADFDAAKPA